MMSKRQWMAYFDVIPTAKGRARQGRYGHFTPPKTRQAETQLKALMRIANPPLFSGALSMRLTFYFKKPKSAKKRLHHTVKPDLTNLAKLVEDAGNGILYIDDKQLVELFVCKQYSDENGVTVFLSEL